VQYQHIGYRIKGFYKLYNYAVKYGMDNQIARHRKHVLAFWERYGLDATLDAFKQSRRTLYNWKQQYRQGGESALAPKSKAPNTPDIDSGTSALSKK
jgi:hypothetical protein